LTGFLPAGGSPTPAALLLGALAAGAAWLALLHARAELASEPAPPAPGHGVRATTIFVVLAILLGLSPLVVGHLAGNATASEYYAFAAAPWLALGLARLVTRLPAAAATAVVVLVVGANTATRGFQVPDLSVAEAWVFKDWNWSEALRLSAVSERLGSD